MVLSVHQATIRIGRRDLKAYEDDPLLDGVRYTIEANGNQRRKNEQHLHPIQFTGTTFDKLPDALEVLIYEVQTSFQPISMLSVSKAAENRIRFLMSFSFSTWEMPESLGIFVERYVSGLNASPEVAEATFSKGEYGFEVTCEARPSGDIDIFGVIQRLEVTAASVYRDTIIPPSEPTAKVVEVPWQWWLRYVIVPVVCSGGVAAVLAKLLLQ